MVPHGPILTWYKVTLGVIVAGVRVPVDTSMLAANAEEVHARCARVAEGMGGRLGDVRVEVGNPVGERPQAPPAGYLPPPASSYPAPCTYKPEPIPDKIQFDLSEGFWEEYTDISPGAAAYLGGPSNDKAAK